MKWIVITETILLILAIYKIYDLHSGLRTMIKMWEEDQNKKWLNALEESGAEIIKIREW